MSQPEIFLIGGGALYVVLQIAGLIVMKDSWRRAVMVPAWIMACAIGFGLLSGLVGLQAGPIWLFLALPLAIAYLVVLFVIRAAVRFRP